MVAKCCTEGFTWTGQSTGSIAQIDNVDVYLTGDTSSRNLLLYLPDILGIHYKNSQLVADNFGRNGYCVLLVDTFNRDPVPEDRAGFDRQAWRSKHSFEDAQGIAEKVLTAARLKFSPQFVASVGYCFGANLVGHLLGQSAIDVGAWAHPSGITEQLVGDIKKPLIIAAAETDSVFTPKLRDQTLEILAKLGATYELQVFSGTSHGFACRGNPDEPAVYRAMKKAFNDQLWYFDQFKSTEDHDHPQL